MDELKPCPFCGGNDIKYSIKTTGRFDVQYHCSMYCNDCHCYGTRVLTSKVRHSDYDGRREIETNEKYRKLAIKAWNTRADGWIPVSERLPSEQELEEHNKLFLVFTQDSEIPFIAYRFAHIWSDGCCALDVIAWQPLPQPYKEEK